MFHSYSEKEIKEELPELDDDFAKEVSEFELWNCSLPRIAIAKQG